MWPEIVYNVMKKLGCIFVENHNLESIPLKGGQTIGQEKQGQTPVESSDARQTFTERSNDTETRIRGNAVKAGPRAYSLQSIENRK